MEASESGHNAVVKVLVDNGADVEEKNKVCVLYLRDWGIAIRLMIEIPYKTLQVKILTSFQEGQTALYKASYYGQSAVVDTLLNAKAQVNVENKVTINFCVL